MFDEVFFELLQVVVQVFVSFDFQGLELENADLLLLYVFDHVAHERVAVENLLHAGLVDAVADAALVDLVEECLSQLVLVLIEDEFPEEVEGDLRQSAGVSVAHVEAVELPEDAGEHLGDDLEVVPLFGEHVEEVFPFFVFDVLDDLLLDVPFDEFFLSFKHAAIAFFVFCDFHDLFLV